jgi:hypothetical protein
LPVSSRLVLALRRQWRGTLHTVRFDARSRRAMTRKTLSAKCGVWLMRKRNCFSPTGTSFEHAIAEADLDLAVLNDEQLLGIVTLTEDDIARLKFAHRHACASQYPKIDRRIGHKQGPWPNQLSPLVGSAE